MSVLCRVRLFLRCFCIVGTATFLSGCLTSFSAPERLFPVSTEIAALRSQPELIPDFKYYANLLSETQRVLYRNGLIEARVRATDIQYSQYEIALTEERQASELLAGAATIALTGTSALINPVATKDILTQIAGGITGINGVFNDKVLLSKTIQVLQHQMRAERDRIAVKIFDGLRQSSLNYSLAMGLADTEDYYRAGTLAGALIDISQTVSNEAAAAKRAKDTYAISYGYASDTASKLLRDYIWPGGTLDKAHRGNITAIMKQLGITAPISKLVNHQQLLSDRENVATFARKAGYF